MCQNLAPIVIVITVTITHHALISHPHPLEDTITTFTCSSSHKRRCTSFHVMLVRSPSHKDAIKNKSHIFPSHPLLLATITTTVITRPQPQQQLADTSQHLPKSYKHTATLNLVHGCRNLVYCTHKYQNRKFASKFYLGSGNRCVKQKKKKKMLSVRTKNVSRKRKGGTEIYGRDDGFIVKMKGVIPKEEGGDWRILARKS